jgi:hypothetical protein
MQYTILRAYFNAKEAYNALAQENSEEEPPGFNVVEMVFDAGKIGNCGD